MNSCFIEKAAGDCGITYPRWVDQLASIHLHVSRMGWPRFREHLLERRVHGREPPIVTDLENGTRPRRRVSIVCASSIDVAIGFSQNTCLPASIAAIAIAVCFVFGVVTYTASTESISSSMFCATAAPVERAICSARSVTTSCTEATVTR